MDRRSFIKLTAVTGASATLANCGNPENQLIRFVPDDDLVPGVAVWKPSVCPLCSAGCGLSVRVMEADVETVRGGQAGVVRMGVAKKLEGNPLHPVNQGALCARGQAALQVTFHPDRITQPLKRSGSRGDGRYEAITWDAALAELTSKLDALAAAGNQRALTFLSRRVGSQRQALVEEFLARFGAPPQVTFELFGDDVLRRANALSFGREQVPTVDLARARYVVSFGADFLGTWNSPVAQGAAYGVMRQGRPGLRGAFVQVESRMSQTGANADEWVPVTPGTEGVLALGLAQVIVSAKLRLASAAGRAGALIDGWSGGLVDFTPERVAAVTGVPAPRIERLARAFAGQTPSVAVIGGAPLAHTNGLFNALAVNALSALVGSVGQPGGLHFTPQPPPLSMSPGAAARATASPSIEKLAADLLTPGEAPVQLLMIDGANPVFTTPRAWKVRDAIGKVPYIVSFGHFLDETSILADLILPDHTFLESWVDAIPESGSLAGVLSMAPPAMRPLYQTRSTPDVLLEVGRALAMPLAPAFAWQTYDEMLKMAFASLPVTAADADAWTAAQTQGGWWGDFPASALVRPPTDMAPSPAASVVAYAEPQFDSAAEDYPFHFLPYPSSAFLDGSLAHLPWLQEMPDPLTSAMWSSWIEINPATAERLGIALGDMVDVASVQGTLRAPAVISPGIAPDIIAMPAGQGHQTYTRYASGRGENPIALLAPLTEASTGALAWAATRVRISRVGDPDGRLILFAGGMREEAEPRR
ncbi:MAG: molybdopterin-dependent oxidoreductase [Vicinamibacterales bacterium]